jgi:hypothetical protein
VMLVCHALGVLERGFLAQGSRIDDPAWMVFENKVHKLSLLSLIFWNLPREDALASGIIILSYTILSWGRPIVTFLSALRRSPRAPAVKHTLAPSAFIYLTFSNFNSTVRSCDWPLIFLIGLLLRCHVSIDALNTLARRVHEVIGLSRLLKPRVHHL